MPATADPPTPTAPPAADRPVPAAFLFRFAVDLPRVGDGGPAAPFELPAAAELPHFAGLDGVGRFATVRVGWTPAGLAVAVEAGGKEKRPHAAVKKLAAGDGLHLWIDTRPSGTAHRAGRFCRRFALLPSVGQRKQPGAYEVPLSKAGGEADPSKLDLPLKAKVTATGYTLAAFLPAELLPGFDPESTTTLALHTVVADGEKGDQPLTVDAAFPTAHDPSLWTRAELGNG